MPDALVANYGYNSNVGVRVALNASTARTNTLNNQLWRDPLLPLITGVLASGCGPTTTSAVFCGSPLQVSGCFSNATVTLTGSNLNSSATVTGIAIAYTLVTQLLVYSFASVLSASPTRVVLQLPVINNTLTPLLLDTQYQYYLSYNRPSASSNVFLVSFSSSASQPSFGSPSSGLSPGAIAGVVLAAVVAAVLLMVLLLVCLRRRSMLSPWLSSKKTAGSSGEDGFGSSLTPRRLQEEEGAKHNRGAAWPAWSCSRGKRSVRVTQRLDGNKLNVACAATYAPLLTGLSLVFYVDNSTDVHIINRQATRSKAFADLLRQLYAIAL